MRSTLSTSIPELLLLPKFDSSSSSVTQDKEISQVIITKWHHYRLTVSTQWNSFNVYLVPRFDISSFSLTEDIDFQTSHFDDFEQFKTDNYFSNIEQVKIDPIWSFLLTLGWSLLFYWVWIRHATKNNSNPLFDKNSRTSCIRSGTSHFHWSNQ